MRDLRLLLVDFLNVTIPWVVAEDAFEVIDLQCSQQPSSVPVQIRPTHVVDTQAGTVLAMQHLADDSDRRVRAHVTSLLGAPRCHTDLQASDGCGMLLRYVSSNIAKCHDVATSEALYSSYLTGLQAASSFLRTIRPLQPEMPFTLCMTKVSWTTSRTKRLAAPTPDNIDGNHDHLKYIRRSLTQMGLSFV